MRNDKVGRHLSPYLRWALTLWFFFLMVSSAEAAKITRVQGKKVTLDLQGARARSGERVTVRDKSGKKRGVLEIEKVRNGKAQARLAEGKVQKGWRVENSAWSAPARSPAGSPRRKSAMAVGLLAGVSMDTMMIKFNETESATLNGMGSAVRLAVDLPLFSFLVLRLGLGQEQFKVSGSTKTAVCSGSTDCNLSVPYTTLDLVGRLLVGNFWYGGGFSYFMKGSPTTNAIDTKSVQDVFVLNGEVGYDIKVGRNSFIPLQVGLGLMPPSNSVTPLFFSAKVGFFYSF